MLSVVKVLLEKLDSFAQGGSIPCFNNGRLITPVSEESRADRSLPLTAHEIDIYQSDKAPCRHAYGV